MPYITREVDRKRDKVIVSTHTPKARVWEIAPDKVNYEYEDFLEKQAAGQVIVKASSGSWHDGVYRVQAHYYEISTKEEELESVDRTTDVDDIKKIPKGKPENTDTDIAENKDGKNEDQPPDEKSSSGGLVSSEDFEKATQDQFNDALDFDSGMRAPDSRKREDSDD